MSNWDKWLNSDSSRTTKNKRRDFDDYDGEAVEKSKSKRKTHRERVQHRIDDLEDNLY